ncbi:MAG TPA: thioredoxin family protein [Bacteroidia bacterium]|nr:thioredoxin family protein [Bacteroidia bacterium]
MKHLLILFTVFICLQLNAQVSFIKTDWSSLKAKAKAEKKLIFIDAYTDWCGWCKVMDKETFADKQVADLMNRSFVATKLEMEKDVLGSKLSRKYIITSFPSFLILDEEGKLLHIIKGYQKPKDFMQTLEQKLAQKEGVNRPGYNHANLDLVYPDFYVSAFAENGKRKFPTDSILNRYLDKQKDYFTEINANVMFRFSHLLNDKYLSLLVSNESKYAQLFGAEEISDAIWSSVVSKMRKLAKDRNEKGFAELEARYGNVIAQNKESRFYFYSEYYKSTEKWELYVSAIQDAQSSGIQLSNSFINSAAWELYEKCDNNELLVQAKEWMSTVVNSDKEYDYLDTYAALLFKTNNPKEAREYARLAIEAGKRADKDVKATEELLLKIEKSLESGQPAGVIKVD